MKEEEERTACQAGVIDLVGRESGTNCNHMVCVCLCVYYVYVCVHVQASMRMVTIGI